MPPPRENLSPGPNQPPSIPTLLSPSPWSSCRPHWWPPRLLKVSKRAPAERALNRSLGRRGEGSPCTLSGLAGSLLLSAACLCTQTAAPGQSASLGQPQRRSAELSPPSTQAEFQHFIRESLPSTVFYFKLLLLFSYAPSIRFFLTLEIIVSFKN